MILTGDCRDILPTLEKSSVDCIVTSPPYFRIRDNKVPGQIGMEDTPEEYLKNLVDVFRKALPVLKNKGTIWINIGDTYDRKDLLQIPDRLALALKAELGLKLRNKIVWYKPNANPEDSRITRCASSYELILFFTKIRKGYYWDGDAIREPYAEHTKTTWGCEVKPLTTNDGTGMQRSVEQQRIGEKRGPNPTGKATKRDVWIVARGTNPPWHSSTFPEKLIEPCILAGCPPGGVVLDPFMGSGTTAIVALNNGRDFIGIDINPVYVERAIEERIPATKQTKIPVEAD